MEILIALTVLSAFYLFPYLIAVVRNLPNRRSILLLDLLLGWTVVGWIAAFVWVVRTPSPVSTARVERLPAHQPCLPETEANPPALGG
jgi:hypothetical protein